MSGINCTIGECQHNQNCQCCLESISVSGGGTSSNTCCDSFSKGSGFQSSNETPCSCHSIACEAHDCVHNDNCECHADNISVCACSSDCNCDDDTQCSSFCPQ